MPTRARFRSLSRTIQGTEALEDFERCLSIMKNVGANRHQITAYCMIGVGQATLGLGRTEQAIRVLESADELTRALEGDRSPAVAEARFFLAQALWEQGRNRQRALNLVRQAREIYAGLKGSETELAGVEAWLAAHARK